MSVKAHATRAAVDAAIRRALLRWFAGHQRRLPWRSRPTPYRVWVSEIMLQQTQVTTVLPYFRRFVRRFPNVRSLAAADLADVLAQWAGLGYYGRARNLHAAARIMMNQPGAQPRAGDRGRVPATLDGLLALPGVGRYTAGAILSIAFNRPAPILDGNVTRVLCRLFAIGGDPKRPPAQRRLWRLAGRLVDPRRPSQFNQAMMELGALVCSPAAPDCPRCPLSGTCRAFGLGRQEAFGVSMRRAKAQPERWAVAIIRKGGRALMTRRATEGRWAGLWEFPGLIVEGRSPAAALRQFLRSRFDLRTVRANLIGSVRHQITHRDMTVEVFLVRGAGLRIETAPDRQWVLGDAVCLRPVSTLTRKIASLVAGLDKFQSLRNRKRVSSVRGD